MENNTIEARKVTQNNQEFLVGIFKIIQIKTFTRYTERLIVGFREIEEDQFGESQLQILPEYNPQIQRKTNNSKVERIADFLITDPTAMFPTNIVIAIPQQVIDLKEEDNKGNTIIVLNPIVKEELKRPNGNVFLTIIDGQHRIKGIERAIERIEEMIDNSKDEEDKSKNEAILYRLLNLELIVTFFIDPILEYQAMIFSIINKTQTKVPENLVFSLFGLTKNDTPQKTSLEVVLALNGLQKSPFFNRIKLVGGNYKRGEIVPLSQATMVKSVLFNISRNQRDSEIDRNLDRIKLNDSLVDILPFRRYYSSNNDKMIVRIMYSYFSAVRSTFINDENGLSYWDFGSTPTLNVLQTNVGYQALMKLLVDILQIASEEDKDKKAFYSNYLMKAKNINFADDGDEKRYPFTSRSVKVLYNDLKEKIGI